MNDFERKCYGMSQADIRTQYMEGVTAELSGLEMVVMGILSDCQEMIAMKNPTIPAPNTDEFIRKQMNIAKFILSEMMDQRDELLASNSRKIHNINLNESAY
jgi:hypothetical protein